MRISSVAPEATASMRMLLGLRRRGQRQIASKRRS
jgi:hypothetical protein